MTKGKNIPGVVWLVVGAMIFLALPTGTAAAKAALKFTGIEGTSGNQADVTAAQQLLTTEASPSNYYNNPSGTISGTANPVLLAEPSNGNALIVKSLRLTTLDQGQPPIFWTALFFVGDPSCTSFLTLFDHASGTGNGETLLPYDPGYSIPAGDALCGFAPGTRLNWQTTVTGYQVPASAVPALAGQPQSAAAMIQKQEALQTP